jgi:hypothetical protein
MGYDMHTVITPEGEARAVARAREAVAEAVAERDTLAPDDPHRIIAQEKVERLYESMHKVERSYFRLNIWGMSSYRRAMLELGMAYEGADVGEWPAWPRQSRRTELVAEALLEDEDPSEYLAKYGGTAEEKEPARGDELAVARAYFDQTTMLKREHPAGGTTIPLHKLCSNDGWVVTPAECLEALSAWYSRTESERDDALHEAKIEDREYWSSWLNFLQLAAHCDGFEVH